MSRIFLLILSCCILATACTDETSSLPKPRAYPRVLYPTGSADSFALEVCPFSFSKPSYVTVERDTTYFDDKPLHPCWFNLVTPALNGRVHFSYYEVDELKDFERLRDDAFDLAGKHNVVANYIDELAITKPDAQVYGFAFQLEGDVASPFQFYVTDSTNHFLRGALYVDAAANADSLAPVYEFLQDDLLQVIETLRWQ